ncbi:MAG: hypothetical protein WCE90_09405 [Candidatus Zixiibacteriota bacterium]
MKGRLPIFLVIAAWLTVGMNGPQIRGQQDDLSQKKQSAEIQKIVQLKIKIKTEREKELLERIGLECVWGKEVICKASEKQMNQLKMERIDFEVQREGLKFRTGEGPQEEDSGRMCSEENL